VQLTRRESTRSANSTTASDASVLDAEAESGFNISTLTEEAVTAACLGFDQRRLPPQDLHGANGVHSAVLVLNIDEALGLDWMFSIASGSWKRICINLVSNALKYTPSGYINVTLRKTWLKRKASIPRTALVELVVSLPYICMAALVTDCISRLKILVLACPTIFKSRVYSGHSSRRTVWHRVQGL
jgi:hypothetical protein